MWQLVEASILVLFLVLQLDGQVRHNFVFNAAVLLTSRGLSSLVRAMVTLMAPLPVTAVQVNSVSALVNR